MSPAALDPAAVRSAVAAALAEDLGSGGDVTSASVVPDGARATARLVARADLVVAGLPVAEEVFRSLDRTLRFESQRSDGDLARRGDRLATVRGSARPILEGERTALNFLGRMCGIATAARACVEEVAGTGATILDTRKTAPGLRALDKYAVSCGGATNHRMGLFDAVMIKDTHLAVAGPIGRAVGRALAAGHAAGSVTVEVRTPGELEEAIRAGAGRALLDNMDPATLVECVRIAGGRIALEASGGLRPGGLRAAAVSGVAFLSLGWLTHSAPAADVAMEMEAGP